MSKIVPKFRCRIDNGIIHWEGMIQDSYEGYLQSLPDGFYDLYIKKPSIQSPRSNHQNRYYWLILGIVSEHTGYTDGDLHDYFKAEFLLKPMILGTKQSEIPRSTTELNTIEMEKYLENIRMFSAMELQLNIPEPNEVV